MLLRNFIVLRSGLFCVLFAGEVMCQISTKLDFGGDNERTSVTHEEQRVGDDDVEVKHTIVVSTKINNNNQHPQSRGFRHKDVGNGRDSAITYSVGANGKPFKNDDLDVPIDKAYKAVDTTVIRTPDSRLKNKTPPESYFITRNIRDDYDVYPNVPLNGWRPSSYYNNINWRGDHPTWVPVKDSKHKKISDESVKEFYCNKCRELSKGQNNGCGYSYVPSVNIKVSSTTPKVKIDGKIAKLD